MNDFIKLVIHNADPKHFEDLPGLEFKSVTSHTTGNVEYPVFAHFHNFKIVIHRNRVEISGSLHILYNELQGKGAHNANDFFAFQIAETIDYLARVLDFDPVSAKVVNLEYGVNLKVNFSVSDVIRTKIYSYRKYYTHNAKRTYQRKGQYWMFQGAQFYLKLYDKGRQHNLGYEVLRIEMKATKSAYLSSMGINTLADLGNFKQLADLKRDLLVKFDKLLILNSYDEKAPHFYWNNLKDIGKSESTISREWHKFIKRQRETGQLELMDSIRLAILAKWEYLMNHD